MVESEISNFILTRENELNNLDVVSGISLLDQTDQHALLSTLMLRERDYQEIALVDSRGHEQIRISLTSVILAKDLKIRNEKDGVLLPLRSGQTYFSPVRFDPTIREPLITIAVPLTNRRSGQVAYLLIADLRVKRTWDLLGTLNQPDAGEVYVVDQEGRVIAHANPAVVLSNQIVPIPPSGSRATGLSGSEVLSVTRGLRLGDQELTIIVEQPVAVALELATSTLWTSLLIGAAAIAISVLLVILAIRQIVKPVEDLAVYARSIMNGQLSQQIPVTRRDEIGDLENAFNLMAEQLSRIIQSLELRVAERSFELEQTGRKIEALLAELEEKNEELEQFIITVSHDLKSPLVTISGFLGYLRQEALNENNSRMLEDIARISAAAEKMHLMLEELLDLSRIGRKTTPPQELPFEELAQEAAKMVSGRLHERGVEVEIAPGLPVVRGDLPRLREALENLLDNAVKYMGDQPLPLIRIGVREQGDEPVFIVQDNGMGIEAAYHDRIFDLFEQLDPAAEGSGMGLAIARRIIEMHGGRLWVESPGAGKGSTFCFTLPRQEEIETKGDHERRAISHSVGRG